MTCNFIKLPTGETAIVCGPRRHKRCSVEACKAPGLRLCDWKVEGGGTCDKPVCAFHSYAPPKYDDKDLCQDHAAEWKRRIAAARGAKP